MRRLHAKWLSCAVGALLVVAAACDSGSGGAPPSSSAEGGTACVPGRQVSCPCAGSTSGIQVCNAEGSGYDACVCPAGDASVDVTDASASDAGEAGPPSGTPLWIKGLGITGDTATSDVAIDSKNGDVVIAGTLTGSADFGGGVVGDYDDAGDAAAVGPAGFVARYDSSGAYKWARVFYGPVTTRSVAIDGAGNVLVTGELAGTTDFGNGSVSATGSKDLFAAKFGATGTLAWAKHFGVASSSVSMGRAVMDAAGNIFMVAEPARTALDVGCGAIAAQNTELVAKLGPNGACVWSVAYSAEDDAAGGQTQSETIALDASGNVLVAGGFTGSVDLGEGGVYPGGGVGPDAFLQKLAPNGALIWVKTWGGPGAAVITGIGCDASGNIFVDGSFCYNELDFGCGKLSAKGNGGSIGSCEDIFLAKLDPSGACTWSKSFGDSAPQFGGPLVVDSMGGPAITGSFAGSVDFGSGVALTSTESNPYAAAYVAKFTASGAYEWAYAGNPPMDSTMAIGTGVAASGALVAATGTFFYGSIDVAGHTLTSTSHEGSYLATFAR